LAFMATQISPVAEELAGIDKLAAETPRQVANAHTIFNLANTLIFIGFVTPMAKLVEFLVPKRERAVEPVLKTKYLDDILLDTPELALDRVQLELQRVGERAYHMVDAAIPLAVQGSARELRKLAVLDDEVDALHGQILAYLGAVTATPLKKSQARLASLYLSANNNLEAIGDIVETNIVHAGVERAATNAKFSQASVEKIQQLHTSVLSALETTLDAMGDFDYAAARSVLEAKTQIAEIASDLESHLAERLTSDREHRVIVFGLESEIVEYLKRTYYFTKRIAKEIVSLDPEKDAGDKA